MYLVRKGETVVSNSYLQEVKDDLEGNIERTPLYSYRLVVPENLFEKFRSLADREHTTVVDLIRRAMKMFLFFADVEEEYGMGVELILRRQGEEDRIVVFQV